MDLKVFPLDAARREDFFRLHAADADGGWCFCVAWWTSTWNAWGMRTGAENRQRREQLFQQNVFDGYLLYDGTRPIGWCQCCPRDYLLKLADQYKLQPDPAVYAVTCFLILPAYREIGLTHYFLKEIINDLRRQGVKTLQAFPKRGKNLAADNVWTGPEAVFQKAGFELIQDDPTFPIYSLELNHIQS